MTDLSVSLAEALDPVVFARARGFVAEVWQAGVLRSAAPRALVACSRQVGKTTTTGHRALWTALTCPERDVLIVSPTQRQSDEMLARIASIYRGMRGPKLARSNASELGFMNGSRIVSLPGSEGGIRGFANVRLLILDEAARIEDDVYASAVPMVGSDGQLVALSTPWGRRGWFFEAWDDDRAGWERHRVTVFESGQYGEARIAQMKASVGSFVWASDYLAEFGDNDSSLFRGEDVRRAFVPLPTIDLGVVS